MSDDALANTIFGIFTLVVIIITALFAGLIVQSHCDDHWRDQLTNSGHAEYFLDSDNKRQWRMKEIK